MGTAALMEPESAVAVDSADFRSIRLKKELEESWQTVKRLPLAERERWLNTQEAINAFGASRRADILRSIEQKREQLQLDVPRSAVPPRWQTHRHGPQPATHELGRRRPLAAIPSRDLREPRRHDRRHEPSQSRAERR